MPCLRRLRTGCESCARASFGCTVEKTCTSSIRLSMDWGDGGRLCIRPDFPVRARRSHALVNWAWSCSQAGFIALRRNSRRPTSSARASSVGGTSRPSTAAGHTRYHARFGQALVWEQRRGRRTRRKFMRGAILLPQRASRYKRYQIGLPRHFPLTEVRYDLLTNLYYHLPSPRSGEPQHARLL